MDSRFDDWIYWHFFAIKINYARSQSMTVYDHDSLLFYCDEWQPGITAHTLNFFWVNYDSCLTNAHDLRMNSILHVTSMRPEYMSPYRPVNCPPVYYHGNLCLATCYLATTRSLLFVAPGMWLPSRYSAINVRSGSTIPTFRRCLPNRCLAMEIRHNNNNNNNNSWRILC
jgi:hypothetical protein